MINFVDAGRQWLKAKIGIGAREIQLATSPCAHVILEGDFVEILDTRDGRRMWDNTLCIADGRFRLYAGAVLRAADGLPIGTFCGLDQTARQLDALQRDTLRLLAAQVMWQLDLRAAMAREALLRREIDRRVKSSVQNVGAFVRPQRHHPTGDMPTTLLVVERQIASVAILNETISEVYGEWLDLGDYFDQMTHQLAIIAPVGITMSGLFELLSGPSAAATALGSIVNELVANSLKHSFDEDVAGRIAIKGSARDDGSHVVACSDNGEQVAPPVITDAPAQAGLGLRVIRAAIRAISRTLVGGPVASGYRSVLEFPEPLH